MKHYFIITILLILFCCKPKIPAWVSLIDPNDTARVFFDTVAFHQKTKGLTSLIDSITVDGINIRQIKSYDGYFEEIIYPDSLISDTYWFYPSGRLKQKGRYFKLSFSIGKYYFYDESGKLINVEDFDAPYKYSLDSVLQFILDQNLDISDYGVKLYRDIGLGRRNRKDSIVRDPKNPTIIRIVSEPDTAPDRAYWKIEKFNLLDVREITLDGLTGEILEDTLIMREF